MRITSNGSQHQNKRYLLLVNFSAVNLLWSKPPPGAARPFKVKLCKLDKARCTTQHTAA